MKWVLESTDCVTEAFKLESGVIEGIDKCIDAFEEKRTEKW